MSVLGDYLALQRGTTYKSALLGQPGPVLLGLGSIGRNGGFRDDNLKTYGGSSDPRILLAPGDVYVSLKDVTQSADLLGAVARVPDHIASGRLTQDTVKLVFSKDAPVDYLYWLLRTPQYREYCRAHSTGTTNLGLPREDFLNYPVPKLTECRRVTVELLIRLEAKIELNRRMNESLEAMAQAIFRDWFVDFGPVRRKMAGATDPSTILGGLLPPGPQSTHLASLFPDRLGTDDFPEGWTLGALKSVAEAVSSTVNPTEIDAGAPYIGLEHMPRRSIMLSDWGRSDDVSSNKTRFKKGQVLFGKLRPYFHKVGIAPVDGICSTDIVVLDSKQKHDRALITCCVSSGAFVAFTDLGSDGTKMPRTSWPKMRDYPLVIACENVRKSFNDIVKPTHDRIVQSVAENKMLSETRDYLLPKLMSGQISARELVAMETAE